MYTNIPRAGWSPDDDSLKVVDIIRRTSPQQFMLEHNDLCKETHEIYDDEYTITIYKHE